MLRNFYASAVLLLSIAGFLSPVNAQTVTLSLSTNNIDLGDIVINLFPDDAPISVENFLGYVNRGDYNESIIHRSVPGFVVQAGGFSTNPRGQIPIQDPILNEFGRSNLRGTVAYARQPEVVNSATSQFFFNVTDNVGLDTVDGGFTVFGEVVSGMDLVDAINAVPTVNLNQDDNPDVGPFGEVPLTGMGSFIEIDSATVAPAFVVGDVSGDGVVNFLDITPFIAVLTTMDFQNEADINRDGMINFLDITPFIALLTAGG